jgi:hypothetical protein
MIRRGNDTVEGQSTERPQGGGLVLLLHQVRQAGKGVAIVLLIPLPVRSLSGSAICSRAAVASWPRSRRAVVNLNAVAGRVADRSVVDAVCYIESDRAGDDL